MKLTNKKGLPQTFVTALSKDYHKGADYSASQLTKPIRMVHLENRHKGEVSEDVTDRIWSLFGSAVHSVLQQGETENQLVEQYLKEEIAGVTLSGMADLWEDGIIYDYKVTSVWSWIFMEDKMDDWISQLNTYAWLFRKANIEVGGLRIVMILRDWQASKAKYDTNYPDCQVQIIEIPLMDQESIEGMIKLKISAYEDFKETPDNELPFCTDKEKWVKPPKYAVMKKGRKSAIKLFDFHDQAMICLTDKIHTQSGEFYIEERSGDRWRRCEYCSVSAFCNQYKGLMQ